MSLESQRPRWLAVLMPCLVLALLAGLAGFVLISDRAALAQSTTAETTAAASGPFSPDQKKAIEAIIKDYLVNNPEVMIEVQSNLEIKMQKMEAEKMKASISQNAKDIFRSETSPVAGNKDGDITVVEFFDYNCGFCKKGFPNIAKLIEQDKKVRVVLKELPILSKGSEEASRVALAAANQGKYWEVHQALLNAKGQVNEVVALNEAGKLGLDLEKLKADMNSDAVKAELEKVQTLAGEMGISGTPHFLIGDRSIGGAPDDLYDQLAKNAAELRKSGCPVC